MQASRDELIAVIPKNFPDPNDDKYWVHHWEGTDFQHDSYWEAVGAWWYVVLNTEDEDR